MTGPSLKTRLRWLLSRGKFELLSWGQALRGFKKETRQVDWDSLLVGDQAGMSLEKWVALSGELERVSVTIKDSPYVRFLEAAGRDESRLQDGEFLEHLAYFRMAQNVVRHKGSFFGASDPEGIKNQMRAFYQFFKNPDKPQDFKEDFRHSRPGENVLVYQVEQSNCYEIKDGHHRAAAAFVRGEPALSVSVIGRKRTYLQKLLLSCLQVKGAELYQPVERPEVRTWTLVRQCADRWEMMKSFLGRYDAERHVRSVLDLPCAYGWFVKQFKDEGYQALGIDRDPNALQVGRAVYGLSEEDLKQSELISFLKSPSQKYDAVLFLSLLHHFGYGKEAGKTGEVLAALDALTRRVLFLDSGQNHEAWFKDKLPGWNDDFIEAMILKNTAFKKVYRLGRDRDRRAPYQDQYQRTLFACVKDE